EPHARDSRRAQAALPLPLGRLSDRRARVEDRAGQGAGDRQGAVRSGGAFRAGAAQGGSVQSAGRGRDAGLGGGAGRARRGRARSRNRVRHVGSPAQIPGRHHAYRGQQGEGTARRRARPHAGSRMMAQAQEQAVAGRLAENIVHFARALRVAGIPVGPGAALDALAAVRAAGVGTREDFYWTLHAVFVKRHEHSLLFDQAFRIFFRRRGYLDKLIASLMPQAPPREPEAPKPGAQRVEEALFSGLREQEPPKPEHELDARPTVPDRELLQRKDFAQMSAAEIAAAKEAIKRLVLSLDEVKTRRLAPHRHGHLIDIRRTFRSSLKAGGALIDLKY